MNLLSRHARSPRLGVMITVTACALLAACATPPAPPPLTPSQPVLRVVLLPQQDANGQPLKTAVNVQDGSQTLVLDQAFALAERAPTGALAQRVANAEEVKARYGDVLRIQPPTPEVFVLRFQSGKSQLTPDSEAQLPMLIDKAKARAGGELIVIGHTDTTGKAEANDALSLQRARAIANLLVGRGFSADLVTAIGRGERELAVPTADEVAEPRNRRAEIVIR